MFLTAIGMTVFWLVKFFKDEDLCQIDFKSFDSFSEGSYPMLSFCMGDPYITSRLKEYNPTLNQQRYQEILRGETSYNGSEKIDFDFVTLNLADFYLGDQILFRNGTEINGAQPKFLHDMPSITSVGIYSHMLWKCFGLRFNHTNVEKASFRFNSTGLQKEVEGLGWFLVRPHLPNKLLMVGKNDGMAWRKDSMQKELELTLIVKQIEILRRRNKRSDPCIPDSLNYDETILDYHLQEVGCRAPYQKTATNWTVCGSKEKTKEAIFDFHKIMKSKPACVGAETINYIPQKLELNKYGKDVIHVNIVYPDRFKEILMVKAVDIHSAIGNSGGYIGLFLGKDVLAFHVVYFDQR